MSRPLENLTYTVPEAAQVLNISADLLEALIKRHDLPAMRIGGRVVIAKAALEGWVIANQDSTFAGKSVAS